MSGSGVGGGWRVRVTCMRVVRWCNRGITSIEAEKANASLLFQALSIN